MKKYKLKKKMKNILIAVFGISLFIVSLSLGTNANAKTVQFKREGNLGSYYHGHDKGNGTYNRWGQIGTWETTDGTPAYCAGPGVKFHYEVTYDAYEYNPSNSNDIINTYNALADHYGDAEGHRLNEEILANIVKYAYYGYGYKEHTTDKWRIATQMAIWREIDPGQVFLNSMNNCHEAVGNCTQKSYPEIETMINEIYDLSNNHDTYPSFNMDNHYQLNIGESIDIVDSNNVLSQFKVENCTNCEASINNNVLTLKATGIGNFNVTLTKESEEYNDDAYIALSSSSQPQVIRGNLDPVYSNISGTIFGGKVKLSKTSKNTGKPLADAVYSVKDSSNTEVCRITTNANGEGICENLPTGTYTVKEVIAPHKYKVDKNTYTVILTLAQPEKTLELEDDYITGKVEIYKKDLDTGLGKPKGGATLENANYCIYDVDKKLVDTLITDKTGHAVSKDLIYGEYTMKECKAPEGYLVNSTEEFNISIHTENQPPIVFEGHDKVIEHKFTITKTSSNLNNVELEYEEGAKFDIRLQGKSEVVATLITDKEGRASVTLPYGVYEVTQTVGVHGHFLTDTFTIDIRQSDVSKVLNNKPVNAKLRVIKVDSTNNKTIPLEGIAFKIKNKKTNEYVCQAVTYPTVETICEFKTDKNGIMVTPDVLEPGVYSLEEVDKSIPKYLWNRTSVDFEIGHVTPIEQDETYGPIFEIRFNNTPVKGKVNVLKKGQKVVFKDDSFYYEEVALKNVKIGVYARENIIDGTGTLKYNKNDLVATLITDKDGNASVNNLYLGKYYLKEIETNADHILDTKEYDFELKYENQYKAEIEYSTTLKNYKQTGSDEFTKIDSSTSEPLPNTTMELYAISDKEYLIFKGKTDENGKLLIDKLPQGKYYWLEKEAPEHYVLNEQKLEFEILSNGQVVKSTLENTKYPDFTITKTNLSGTEAVPGATIEIYKVNEDESVELFYEGITDASGKIYVEEIPIGSYYFIETKAPEGYQINEERHPFNVDENGVHYEATITNEKLSTVKLYKKDLSDETILLAGATICIYKIDGTEVACMVTNEDGFVEMQMPIGKYYYKETIAPKDYEIDPEIHYFDITKEGSVFVGDIFDEYMIAAPKTDITVTPLVVGSIGLISGVVLLLLSRKKKQN